MPPKKNGKGSKADRDGAVVAAKKSSANEVKVSPAAAAISVTSSAAKKGGKGGKDATKKYDPTAAAVSYDSVENKKNAVPSLEPEGDGRMTNWRDVGIALRTLTSDDASLGGARGSNGEYNWSMIPINRIYRCGKIDYCSFDELHRPGTIMNLRMGDDPHDHKSVTYLQIAAANNVEKYDTKDGEVRKWLTDVLNAIAAMDKIEQWPLIIHCRSGRDRTGVVVACLLTLLGVPPPLILREFTLSRGAPLPLIQLSLDGWQAAGGLLAYFRRKVDLEKVKRNLLMPSPSSAAAAATTATATTATMIPAAAAATATTTTAVAAKK